MSKRLDEKAKLTATFANNVAVAVIAAGAIGPVAARVFTNGGGLPQDQAIILAVMAFFLGTVLHFGARRLLNRMSDE